MIPFKRRRKVDPATTRGIVESLREAFDADEQAENESLQRLIDQMKDFEGSPGADDEPSST